MLNWADVFCFKCFSTELYRRIHVLYEHKYLCFLFFLWVENSCGCGCVLVDWNVNPLGWWCPPGRGWWWYPGAWSTSILQNARSHQHIVDENYHNLSFLFHRKSHKWHSHLCRLSWIEMVEKIQLQYNLLGRTLSLCRSETSFGPEVVFLGGRREFYIPPPPPVGHRWRIHYLIGGITLGHSMWPRSTG